MNVELQIILTIINGALGGILTLAGVFITLRFQKNEQVPEKIVILNELLNDLKFAVIKIQTQIKVVENGRTTLTSLESKTLEKDVEDKDIMDHWLYKSAKVNKKTYESIKNLKYKYESESLDKGLPRNLNQDKLSYAKNLRNRLLTSQKQVTRELDKLERKIKS